MSETANLKAGLIADIAAADTLEALEALRVGAMGKSGVVTGLLKTLGGMSPEERLEKGPPIQPTGRPRWSRRRSMRSSRPRRST